MPEQDEQIPHGKKAWDRTASRASQSNRWFSGKNWISPPTGVQINAAVVAVLFGVKSHGVSSWVDVWLFEVRTVYPRSG
jgi:hypothetical protein